MNKDFETYYLAKIWKRIIARIIDIIIVSLIPVIITSIWNLFEKNINNWKILLIMIIINNIIIALYFIVFPWKFNGQTLGKIILSIKLIQQENKKIRFKTIVVREIILVFIPMTLATIAILLTSLFLQTNVGNINDKTTLSFWISILNRIIYSFIFAWYLGIIISIKIDTKHQLFYDRKFQIYIITKKQIIKNLYYQKEKSNNTNIVNIHLKEKQPGNINKESLDEIKNL